MKIVEKLKNKLYVCRMKKLTTAEEQVMHILWRLKETMVKDVIDQMPEPRPAYNTVSTVIRVLEKKEFVAHKAYGKTHVYYPTVSKKEYTQFHFTDFLKNYFNNSFPKMASFFAQQNNLSIEDLEELMKLAEDELKDVEGD